MMNLISRLIKFCPKTGRPVKALKKWALPLFSILALIWVLVRVIPKPQRAAYPCMKVAIPFASSLLIYLSGLLASAMVFKKAFRKMVQSKFLAAGFLVLAGLGVGFFTLLSNEKDLYAGSSSTVDEFVDPLGPNAPIGEAKGVMPGRVVWVHNPDATNESCQPKVFGDGYFLDKNCDQELVDTMLITAMLEVTGKETEEEAWSSVFTYFNSTHNKGEVGYTEGEKIYIKINAVHAWTTNKDLSIRNDGSYGNVDTSPQVILAVLRRLINKAGVPEEAIYIGDPYTQVFKHIYEKLHAEFPAVHYMSRGDYDNRDKLTMTNTDTLKYSDRGTVLDKEYDTFYDCTVFADYVLSIPAIKGHRWGGVTFFAKNHFGSNTDLNGASHLHKGLHRTDYDLPVRGEYKSYRVMVDLMSYKNLGGKNLIYIGDLLWGTSYEHDPPLKFRSEPFNNNWSSSILVSLDPVAVASVALDILQEEFQVEDLTVNPPRYTYVRFPAVDDYLHQAASSEWWPEGIVYDPENDGTPIGSLGVHEHWNKDNPLDKRYSRNLETGDGIELIYQNTQREVVDPTSIGTRNLEGLELKAYMSPGNPLLNIRFNRDLQGQTDIRIYAISGQLVQQSTLESIVANTPNQIQTSDLTSGLYVIHVQSGTMKFSQSVIIQ
ncbi:MAG: T9SS type A sorting domain-containing protein [Bacteroidota bacterium]